jgi:hypothetical protein
MGSLGSSPAMGIRSSNSLPSPGLLRTATVPPWAAATAATSGSPSPVPGEHRLPPVLNRLKMKGSCPGVMPVPVSVTTRRADPSGGPPMTASSMASPLEVCRTAFSISASSASASRSRSAGMITLSSVPVRHCRSAAGRQRRTSSEASSSRATGSG